jgi:O-antigen/teichoic acid export membrane protein
MNTKGISKDTLENFLIRIPVILLTFCYSIFLIKLLGPEGNGLFSFISASVSFSIIIFGFNVKRSTLFHIANEKYDSAKILGFATLVHLLAISIVSVFLIVCFLFPSSLSYFFIPKEYFTLFYLLFFLGSFTLRFLTELFKTVLLATKNFRANNRFLIISSFLQTIVYILGFLLVTYVEFDLSLIKLFSLILLVQFIISSLSFYFFLSKYKDGISLKFKTIRQPFLEYASMSYLGQLGQFLNKRLDVWFVEFYVGLRSLGIYALATQFTNFLLEGIAPIQEVLKPYLVNMERKDGNLIFVSFFKLVLYLLLFASSVLILLAPLLITLLFGEVFIEAILPLRILAIGVIFIAVKRIILSYNRAYNDLRYNAWSQWTGVFVTIILDIILIPRYGIKGAALASTISYFCSFLLIAGIFLRQQKVQISHLFIPTKKEVKQLATYLRLAFSSLRR